MPPRTAFCFPCVPPFGLAYRLAHAWSLAYSHFLSLFFIGATEVFDFKRRLATPLTFLFSGAVSQRWAPLIALGMRTLRADSQSSQRQSSLTITGSSLVSNVSSESSLAISIGQMAAKKCSTAASSKACLGPAPAKSCTSFVFISIDTTLSSPPKSTKERGDAYCFQASSRRRPNRPRRRRNGTSTILTAFR